MLLPGCKERLQDAPPSLSIHMDGHGVWGDDLAPVIGTASMGVMEQGRGGMMEKVRL